MEYEDKLIVQKFNIKIVFFKFPFQGKAGFVRPPPLSQGSLHLFYSCVDNVNNPKMYIVFEFDQSYPRYLIKYNFPNQSCNMGHNGYSLSNATQHHTSNNSYGSSNINFAMPFNYPQISNNNLPRARNNISVLYNNPSILTSIYQNPLRPVSYSNVSPPYPSRQNPQPPVSNGKFLAPNHHAPVLYRYPQTPHSNP